MKFKVVSLNIWEGILLDQAIDFLKAQEPDLVLLQEVYGENPEDVKTQFRTLEVLKSTLDLAHSYFEPGLRHHRDEGLFLVGNAIFSRYPITSRDAVFFNEPYSDDFKVAPENNHLYPHTLQHAVLDTPAGQVDAYNIHGTWDLDGDNYSEERRQMSDAVINAVKGKERVILAGDTNARPTNEAMIRVENYLTSVFGHSLETTFNMPRKDNPGYATSAVDMMFVSNGTVILGKDCPEVDISDHLPLVVTLDL